MDYPDHPFRVGRMVYRTISEAKAAIERTKVVYPEANIIVIDRRTGQEAQA